MEYLAPKLDTTVIQPSQVQTWSTWPPNLTLQSFNLHKYKHGVPGPQTWHYSHSTFRVQTWSTWPPNLKLQSFNFQSTNMEYLAPKLDTTVIQLSKYKHGVPGPQTWHYRHSTFTSTTNMEYLAPKLYTKVIQLSQVQTWSTWPLNLTL